MIVFDTLFMKSIMVFFFMIMVFIMIVRDRFVMSCGCISYNKFLLLSMVMIVINMCMSIIPMFM